MKQRVEKKEIKIRVEINEVETTKINETQNWLFNRETKLTNLQLDTPRKKKEEISNKNEIGNVTTDTTEIQIHKRLL